MFIKSNWPFILDRTLREAINVADFLRRQPVLIHCPTGGDGSAVLSSLAQIIIDPFYRTFEGFKSLILKDWVYIQHDFLRKQALTLD